MTFNLSCNQIDPIPTSGEEIFIGKSYACIEIGMSAQSQAVDFRLFRRTQ